MDDTEFLQRFEACTLPFDQWNHRAHVKIAWLYLSRSPFDEALLRVRAGIRTFNQANNVPETPTGGYNETTTRAMLHLVASTMAAYGEALPAHSADEFCDQHPQLMNKHVLRLFYSPERRMDVRAKTEFVEPDLAPLPPIR